MRLALAAILFLLAVAGARAGFNEGVAAYERGDYKASFREFLPLAKNGDAFAQSYLGVMYQYGLGVQPDLAKAVEWYGRAAENGDPLSQRILGDLYAEGAWGAPDYAMAAKWYEFAAQNGDSEARRKLARLRGEGRGIARGSGAAGNRPGQAERNRGPSGGTEEPGPSAGTVGGYDGAALGLPGTCRGDSDAPFAIDVKIVFPQAVIDHSHSIAQLGRISGFGHNTRALGLMKPDLRIETRPKGRGRPVGNKFCFWVTGVDVVLRYQRVDIFIAREYARDSCNYNAILNHEHKHVDEAKRNLWVFAPQIRTALTSTLIPTGREPALVDSQAEARKKVSAISDKLLKPVYDEMIRALIEAQGQVDSPEEYRRVRNLCHNW